MQGEGKPKMIRLYSHNDWEGHCHFCFSMMYYEEGTKGSDLKKVCWTCGSWCVDDDSVKYAGIPKWIKGGMK